MKKICVLVGSRANYSSAKPMMDAFKAHPGLELSVICFATAILDRFGSLDAQIESDGFLIDEKIYSHVEGENPITMVKSTGLALVEIGNSLFRLKPDFVVVVGDRYEMMAGAVAATYLNIPVVHTMGGEVTGTLDESVRHAISKMAHVHFPANEDARNRLVAMGEDPACVFNVGCPRIDEVSRILTLPFDSSGLLDREGVGQKIDVERDFILLSLHPVTTELDEIDRQTSMVLDAIEESGMPTIGLWPNSDAGAQIISTRIRSWREKGRLQKARFFKNLPLDVYVHLMARTRCLVGNSSSGIREGAFIGTPVVNIGSRQTSRVRGSNVIDVEYEPTAIRQAIASQLAHRKYESESIYGDGTACERIAETLAKFEPTLQKRILI